MEAGDVAANPADDYDVCPDCRQLVDRLLAELDQEQDRALRLAIRATGCAKAETERDAALATLARIQAVATDVDQNGGHSGPAFARHILNIIGGEK